MCQAVGLPRAVSSLYPAGGAAAGARVAWRNAPKCSNRKFAMELNLLDCRDCTTPEVGLPCCRRQMHARRSQSPEAQAPCMLAMPK